VVRIVRETGAGVEAAAVVLDLDPTRFGQRRGCRAVGLACRIAFCTASRNTRVRLRSTSAGSGTGCLPLKLDGDAALAAARFVGGSKVRV
jgi:hypothetical protein